MDIATLVGIATAVGYGIITYYFLKSRDHEKE